MRAHALIPRAKAASSRAEAVKAPAPARAEVRQILHAPRPQPKAELDEPGVLEKEADRVADSLMSLPGPGSAAATPPPLQPARGPVPGWPVAEDRVTSCRSACATWPGLVPGLFICICGEAYRQREISSSVGSRPSGVS